MRNRFKDLDWVGIALWAFRAGIIALVIYGIIAKILLKQGTQYSATDWVTFTVSGLSQGSLYALIALGYTMVYGILFMINFAHGEFFMSGAMTSAVFVAAPLAANGFLDKQPVLGLLLIIVAAMTTAVGVALLTERVAYRPLRKAPRLVPLITAIGASFFWQQLFRGLYGGAIIPFPTPEIFQGRMTLFGVEFGRAKIGVMIVSLLVLLGLWILVQRTRTGKAIRAVAEDKDVAALMGIDVDRTISITFAIGAAMAAIAAVFWGLVFHQAHFFMGFVPGIKAFTAAVLGGIGSIPGAAIGGLFLGVIESLGPPLVLEGLGIPGAHQLKDVTAFLLLVLVLIFRPQGILGEKLAEEKA
ncbi:MAG TPA: branched-chain amino acid ABC transporter permease [Patescibacteria group bacterium]|jgi:branched-chain amino acid transport system permease protein|nr:branched-chain amino acid ABC transporter permease [Patescibacteria group bacterium]